MSAKKVIITSDSTTDLNPELIERYNVGILPLLVTLGDKTYTDGVDIDADFIYDYHAKTGELPKTSAINIPAATDFFEKYTSEGYAIVHFTISSEMSSTYQNCCIAAADFEDVYVVDTKNLSTGGGLLVVAAAEMALKGMEAKDIAEAVSKLALNVDASFVIDSLEYLHKGGRCSAVAAFGANLLKLKPCITVKNGKMGVDKKYRGRYSDVVKEYAAERLINTDDIDLDRIFVTHAGCNQEIIDSVVAVVKEALPFKEIFITRAGCAVSSHCGRNTLGVLFVRKSPIA